MWGVLPLALKALQRSLDSTTIVWFRFQASALLVLLLLGARGRLPRVDRLARQGFALLALAALGLGGNYILYMLGLELTTPATAQVVIQLAPPLFALGALALFRERYAPLQWAGFAVVLVGLALFSWSRIEALPGDPSSYYAGGAWVALGALCWAVYGLAQKQLLLELPSQGIMACVYVVCAIAFWPAATPSRLAELTAAELGVLAFSAVNTVVAYGAFAEALAHWEASRVSAVLALTPLATIAAAAAAGVLFPSWIDPDPLPLVSVLGAGLVVLGSLASALGGRRSSADPVPLDPPLAPPPGSANAPRPELSESS